MDYFTFTETKRFVKRAEKLLGQDAISELQNFFLPLQLPSETVNALSTTFTQSV